KGSNLRLSKGGTMVELIQIGALQVSFLRTKHDTGGALDMFEAMVPANARMPVPHHHRDWEETIYGLEGIVTFTVAGERIEVAAGDDLFIPRGVVHGFVNEGPAPADRKSTRLNSSHVKISYAVFCLKKKKKTAITERVAGHHDFP